ncbi:MAG: cytochrome-c peroxidase [Bryobacteraceae bacterium]
MHALLILAAVLLAQAAEAPGTATVKIPLGLLPIEFPADNPYTPEKAELGKLLYFDQRLSLDDNISCATCHTPKFAFTDGARTSAGIHGANGRRSAPTVINRAYSLAQFWDGRAATLEEQAKGPIENPIEMGHTHAACVSKIRAIPGYAALFEKVYGTRDISIDHIVKAIATFERTVLSGDSPYDRYKAGDKKAMSPAQIRGLKVFLNKGKCDACHEGINFTSNSYHNLGVNIDQPNPDVGRFEVTKDPADWGAFKTPTLRDVSRTGPYMHDGSMKTLEDVVEFYDKGGTANKNLDEKMKRLKLTADEKKDLVYFLHALDGNGWQNIQVPRNFPE